MVAFYIYTLSGRVAPPFGALNKSLLIEKKKKKKKKKRRIR
jgi:hypothetical protein